MRLIPQSATEHVPAPVYPSLILISYCSKFILMLLSHKHSVVQMVEALRCKPDGRGFDSRWYHWNFYSNNPSCPTMALGLTQPLTEMSTRNISLG
jgi:hypothetical protein